MLPAARQTNLFDDAPLPPGLDYRADFLTADEEASLLPLIGELPFKEAQFQQYTARRRVVLFGMQYDEKAKRWNDGPRWPAFLDPLRERAAAWTGIDANAFIHVLVTQYRPGTPIGWHRDRPYYESVVGVSLANACTMQFRPLDDPSDRRRRVALALAPRSAYAIRDEMRWRWQHHIPPTKALRYSITMRTRADAAPR